MSQIARNLQKFRLITVDLTDTLLRFKRPPGIVYSETAAAMGLPRVDPDKLTALFPRAFKQMYADYPNFGKRKIQWDTWWEMLIFNVFQSAGTTLSDEDLHSLSDVLIDKYETDECWVVQDGAIELIEKIKELGKKVGIVSNFDPRLRYLVESMKLPGIDFVVGSYEVGAAKPDYRIFDVAVKMSNYYAMPDESLHIGNTPELDYIAAREADFTSVLITNGKSNWQLHKEKIKERFVYESLGDFLKNLETSDIQWDEPVEK